MIEKTKSIHPAKEDGDDYTCGDLCKETETGNHGFCCGTT